ncbi:helix-turn-helix domain-containing protein [Bacillus thuringiensis]|uniref:helix-turn-helix domain-containing protein n=1 Tax=Bacillus thuringiensis TaxID=1428 RepID=UPI000BF83CB0|nr:helix-turn-helix domain-containing protein [Bacillus thuringiensis]PET17065.1 DNA-binding protein [Bacillus thuringiensis]
MYKNYNEYPEILDVSDIQKILGIGRKQAYDLVHSNKFHVLQIGRRIKISKKALIKWIEGEN